MIRIFGGARSLAGARRYSPAELERRGIATLIGSALVVPVLQQNRPLGLISFTRWSRDTFSEGEQSLAAWSGNLLADLIPRWPIRRWSSGRRGWTA